MLVMAVPEWQAIRLGIDRAKALNPRLFVIARATTVRHVEDLRGLHADVVVQPEFEGGVEMVRQALRQCERSGVEIDHLTRSFARRCISRSISDRLVLFGASRAPRFA